MRLFCFTALALPVLFGCAGLFASPEGTASNAECADTLDNDGDGDIDCEDSDCDGLVICANLDTAAADADTDTDSDSDSDADADPVFDMAWDSSGVTFGVDGGSGTYSLGMAQTGGDDDWTGEDCYQGYGGGGTVFAYCHGGMSDGDKLQSGATPYDLVEGETTVMVASIKNSITYYVAPTEGPYCYVWGDDVSYYDALYCTEQ